MDQSAERTARVLGKNAGTADDVTAFDHRAADHSADTFQWLLNATRLLAPTAVAYPATSSADMRDTSLAIATRAVSPQFKAPFQALSQHTHPVDVATLSVAINNIMTDIHNPNWIADIYLRVTDPDEQSTRESINDVILRQTDLLAAYRWAVHITGEYEFEDLNIRAGRGLLRAFPFYAERVGSATATMAFNERSSFETIVRVVKNLSYYPIGQARKRKTIVSSRVAVDRALTLQMLNARLDRISAVIAGAAAPKIQAPHGNAVRCPRAACYGAVHALADCPTFRAEGGCRRCSSTFHLARDCPLVRLNRISAVAPGGATPNIQTPHGNAARCPRAACYGAVHALADCPTFRAEGGCRRCSSTFHLARDCRVYHDLRPRQNAPTL
jgi:hypothetical protein